MKSQFPWHDSLFMYQPWKQKRLQARIEIGGRERDNKVSGRGGLGILTPDIVSSRAQYVEAIRPGLFYPGLFPASAMRTTGRCTFTRIWGFPVGSRPRELRVRNNLLLFFEYHPGTGPFQIEPHVALSGSNVSKVNAESTFWVCQFTVLHRNPGKILMLVVLAAGVGTL